MRIGGDWQQSRDKTLAAEKYLRIITTGQVCSAHKQVGQFGFVIESVSVKELLEKVAKGRCSGIVIQAGDRQSFGAFRR